MAGKRQIINIQKIVDFVLIVAIVMLAYVIGRHDALEYQKFMTEYCEKVFIYQMVYNHFIEPPNLPNVTLNISLVFNITNQ